MINYKDKIQFRWILVSLEHVEFVEWTQIEENTCIFLIECCSWWLFAICTMCCLYLPNISPIYPPNQGHSSVIWICEKPENPVPPSSQNSSHFRWWTFWSPLFWHFPLLWNFLWLSLHIQCQLAQNLCFTPYFDNSCRGIACSACKIDCSP